MNVLIVAILLLAYQAQPHSTPTKSGVRKGNAQAETNDKQRNTNPISSIVECIGCFAVQEPHTQAEKRDPYDARHDSLYRTYLWFTIFGVCGGLIGLCFLIRQTRATQISANQTKRSVDTLVETERAWVQVKINVREPLSRVQQPPTIPWVWIWPLIENCGKTPARIIKIVAREHQLQRESLIYPAPPFLPPEPE